jgi:hypothetical protein
MTNEGADKCRVFKRKKKRLRMLDHFFSCDKTVQHFISATIPLLSAAYMW